MNARLSYRQCLIFFILGIISKSYFKPLFSQCSNIKAFVLISEVTKLQEFSPPLLITLNQQVVMIYHPHGVDLILFSSQQPPSKGGKICCAKACWKIVYLRERQIGYIQPASCYNLPSLWQGSHSLQLTISSIKRRLKLLCDKASENVQLRKDIGQTQPASCFNLPSLWQGSLSLKFLTASIERLKMLCKKEQESM